VVDSRKSVSRIHFGSVIAKQPGLLSSSIRIFNDDNMLEVRPKTSISTRIPSLSLTSATGKFWKHRTDQRKARRMHQDAPDTLHLEL